MPHPAKLGDAATAIVELLPVISPQSIDIEDARQCMDLRVKIWCDSCVGLGLGRDEALLYNLCLL